MAVVKMPAMSMQASGNLGDMNFTRWRGMSVARATYIPDYTPSSKQLMQRLLLANIAIYWGTSLSSDQRSRWEEAAAEQVAFDRLGGQYRPTGYQYYMKINMIIVSVNGEFAWIPPIVPEGIYVGSMSMYWTETHQRVVIRLVGDDDTKLTSDGFQVYRAGPYTSGGRRPIKPEYRFIANESEKRFYLDYDVEPVKWYWYKCRWYMETGFVGNWWEKQIFTKTIT